MWLNLESLAVGAEGRVCNAAVMANDPLRTNRSRVPESELTAPRAARSSLKSSSSTHYMGQDAMAVFAHGRARRLPRQYRCLTAPASQPGALFPALLPLARPRQPLHFVAIPTTKEER